MITPPVLELPNHPRGILGAFHGSHLVADGGRHGTFMEPGHAIRTAPRALVAPGRAHQCETCGASFPRQGFDCCMHLAGETMAQLEKSRECFYQSEIGEHDMAEILPIKLSC